MPDHCPYIPGSEIKGAFRTAALVHWLTQDADSLAELAGKMRPNLRTKELHHIWQETELSFLRAGKKDACNDLFRGMAISDSRPLEREALRLYEAQRVGMSRTVSVWVEAISPDQTTQVTLSIAKPDRWLEEAGLTDKEGWLDWARLAKALYEHSNAVLDFTAEKFPNLRGRAQALKAQNERHAPLTQIGWGQGFLGMTMTLPLKYEHSDAFEDLREALAKAYRQYQRTKPRDFPKSIWAVMDANRSPSDLFGWVKLVPKDET
jgi:CRISPR type III-A-associated RAMP protein Csm5